jgi:hypothetical protein
VHDGAAQLQPPLVLYTEKCDNLEYQLDGKHLQDRVEACAMDHYQRLDSAIEAHRHVASSMDHWSPTIAFTDVTDLAVAVQI